VRDSVGVRAQHAPATHASIVAVIEPVVVAVIEPVVAFVEPLIVTVTAFFERFPVFESQLIWLAQSDLEQQLS